MEATTLTPSQSTDSLHNRGRNADARTLTPTQSVDSLHKSPSGCLAPAPQLLERVGEKDAREETCDNGEQFLACEPVKQSDISEITGRILGESLSNKSLMSVGSDSGAPSPIPPKRSSALDTRGVFRAMSCQSTADNHDVSRLPSSSVPLTRYTSFNIEAGDAGIEAIRETGQITEVLPGGPCGKKGVRVGWRIAKVRGRVYTEELLREAMASKMPYSVTFETGGEAAQAAQYHMQCPKPTHGGVGYDSSTSRITAPSAPANIRHAPQQNNTNPEIVAFDSGVSSAEARQPIAQPPSLASDSNLSNPDPESPERPRNGRDLGVSIKGEGAVGSTQIVDIESAIISDNESDSGVTAGASLPCSSNNGQPTWVIEEVIDFGLPYEDMPGRDCDDNFACKNLSSTDTSREPMLRCGAGSFCYDEEPQILVPQRLDSERRDSQEKLMCL
mmetsp:Transcript_33678/g.53815  ORF Transcript_33678/g.53815 Transcript_33678/m.53815 type:complete len:445 (+) Transcript_33678:115-1449(+)